MNTPLDINANTKIGALLEAYPHLEDVLLSLSPSFAKLKNPVLRKTVGRIASLRQAAEIGGINIGEMVTMLRKAAGMEVVVNNEVIGNMSSFSKPQWLAENNISITFDASDIIDKGGSPMKIILEKADQLQAGEVMLLITPFIPVPIIELLESKGFQCWAHNEENSIYTYIKGSKT